MVDNRPGSSKTELDKKETKLLEPTQMYSTKTSQVFRKSISELHYAKLV